eukprot:TRINITY_DN18064_c0_g1_i1.p1 TRINITY_DN18064_c0_g1~~TRINITY_DN18064_c0_g1_i1.p1  ORF type:complete len:734 (+),score=102.46 TRINITY_DN18064_c0_g1_i1:55-2202(+)
MRGPRLPMRRQLGLCPGCGRRGVSDYGDAGRAPLLGSGSRKAKRLEKPPARPSLRTAAPPHAPPPPPRPAQSIAEAGAWPRAAPPPPPPPRRSPTPREPPEAALATARYADAAPLRRQRPGGASIRAHEQGAFGGSTLVRKALSRLNDRWASHEERRDALATLLAHRHELATPKEFSRAIAVLGRRRRWSEALQILGEMPLRSVGPCAISHTCAMTVCSAASEWQRALHVADSMERQELCMDAFALGAAVSACERGEQWQQALHRVALAEASGLRADVVVMNAVISACGKSQQWPLALTHFSSMKQRGLLATVVTFGAAIGACERGQQWSRALELLAEMSPCGLFPDPMVFSATISACGKGRQWHRALGLLHEARSQDLALDAIMVNATMSACERAGEWEMALVLLKEMPTYFVLPDAVTRDIGIVACSMGHHWTLALHQLCELRTSRQPPTDVTFSAVVSACARAGRWQAALAVDADFRTELGFGPNLMASSALLSACEKGRRWTHAIAELERLRAAGLSPDATVYRTAVMALAGAGETALAAALEVCAEAASQGFFGTVAADGTVDLHGLPVEAARLVAQSALLACARSPLPGALSGLTLIVGRGRGSTDGEALVRPEVLRMLRQEFGLLEAHVRTANPGRIHVPTRALKLISRRAGPPPQRADVANECATGVRQTQDCSTDAPERLQFGEHPIRCGSSLPGSSKRLWGCIAM